MDFQKCFRKSWVENQNTLSQSAVRGACSPDGEERERCAQDWHKQRNSRRDDGLKRELNEKSAEQKEVCDKGK